MPQQTPEIKAPRGQLIRAQEEIGEAQETEQHPIALPLFFFLLTLAGILDLAGFVPALGTILNFIIGPIIWLIYFFVGAKGTSASVKWGIGILMSSDVVLESFPLIQALPLNTLIAVVVYLVLHPRAAEVLENTKGVASRMGYNKVVEAVEKTAKVAGKAVKQAT